MSRIVKQRLKHLSKGIKGAKGHHRAVEKAKMTARMAGLKYISASELTVKRVKHGKSWKYLDLHGKKITKHETLERIRHLAIPPAWADVRIAAEANAHLQVVGTDARGRLQYRYHMLWRMARDLAKFSRMIPFGDALPRLRRRLAEDLRAPAFTKSHVLATVVSLMQKTLIRVGNEEYAEENHSYGLTTMQDHHVTVKENCVTFHFRGKSRKMHQISLTDRTLAGAVQQYQKMKGSQLFQYADALGTKRPITSTEVNEYLLTQSGGHFTSKDFRTWAATVNAALCLQRFETPGTQAELKRNINDTITFVSMKLGNTPTVCRKSYVHPVVLQSYQSQTLCESLKRSHQQKRGLTLGEAAVLAFLKGTMVQDKKPKTKRRHGNSHPSLMQKFLRFAEVSFG